jgi:hypothetical protein
MINSITLGALDFAQDGLPAKVSSQNRDGTGNVFHAKPIEHLSAMKVLFPGNEALARNLQQRTAYLVMIATLL